MRKLLLIDSDPASVVALAEAGLGEAAVSGVNVEFIRQVVAQRRPSAPKVSAEPAGESEDATPATEGGGRPRAEDGSCPPNWTLTCTLPATSRVSSTETAAIAATISCPHPQ